LLFGLSFSLLRPAFLLLGLVAGQGAEGFFRLAFGLVVHSCSSPSKALQGPRLLVRGLLHVPYGDAATRSRALHLGDIHTQLLGLLLGCLRGVRLLAALLLASRGLLGLSGCLSGLIRDLSRGLLGLPGCLTGCVLSLLGRSSGGVLGLARHLACLIGGLSCGLLGLARHLSDLIGDSAQGTSAALLLAAGQAAYGVLDALNSLACLIGGLSRGLLGLARHLACLIGYLSCGLLGLPGCLTGCVLHLLGRSLRGLLDLLLGLLGGLIHLVLDAHVLGRLINRALEFDVGVDHLLDLGLRVALLDLLRILLQLGAVILDLAFEAAYGLAVEVLGVLRGLLLQLLLKIWSLVRHLRLLFPH
jgi:hypothetical protein